jgi:hypothetical protein
MALRSSYDPVTGDKICPRCKESKSLGAFYLDKGRWDGMKATCRECDKIAREIPETKEKARIRQIEYRKANHERILVKGCRERAAKRSIPFAITEADIFIPDTCPLCERPIKSMIGRGRVAGTSPTVDIYNPFIGYVRGNIWILCRDCNRLKQEMSGHDHITFGRRLVTSFREHCAGFSQFSAP